MFENSLSAAPRAVRRALALLVLLLPLGLTGCMVGMAVGGAQLFMNRDKYFGSHHAHPAGKPVHHHAAPAKPPAPPAGSALG